MLFSTRVLIFNNSLILNQLVYFLYIQEESITEFIKKLNNSHADTTLVTSLSNYHIGRCKGTETIWICYIVQRMKGL